MDKIKPAYRRAITMRYLRWTFLKALTGWFPSVKRLLNFYPDAISASFLAGAEVIENRWLEDGVAFTQYDKDYVDKYCALDRFFVENDSSGQARIEVVITSVKSCHVLGHTGTCIDPAMGLVAAPDAGQSSAQWEVNWNQARVALLREKKVPGCSIPMLGFHKGHKQYYHFFVNDFLPLCYYLSRHYNNSRVVNVLIRDDLAGFQKSAYDFLRARFSKINIVPVGNKYKIVTDELILIKYLANNHFRTFSDDTTIRFMRELFFQGYSTDGSGSGELLLYVGRGDAKIRRPVNEAGIIKMLKRYGFRSIEPGRLSHAEQVQLFNSAKLVVGIHGAGLTNVMFCRQGAHLLEISPENYVQSTYMWMAKKIGMGYSYFIAGKGNYHQNFYVDVDLLERAVSGLVSDLCSVQDVG